MMKKSVPGRSRAMPELYGELALASWETILHRTRMILSGTCSVDEYQRMVMEKSEAMHRSALALMSGASERAVLAPFHTKARANAKRLRRNS
jgi:hypothetical protein